MIYEVLLFFFFHFSSLSTHAAVKAGAIFDPKTWPEDVQELATYGEADLHTLLEHFWSSLERKRKIPSTKNTLKTIYASACSHGYTLSCGPFSGLYMYLLC